MKKIIIWSDERTEAIKKHFSTKQFLLLPVHLTKPQILFYFHGITIFYQIDTTPTPLR